jgi:hypothetical protein
MSYTSNDYHIKNNKELKLKYQVAGLNSVENLGILLFFFLVPKMGNYFTKISKYKGQVKCKDIPLIGCGDP